MEITKISLEKFSQLKKKSPNLTQLGKLQAKLTGKFLEEYSKDMVVFSSSTHTIGKFKNFIYKLLVFI